MVSFSKMFSRTFLQASERSTLGESRSTLFGVDFGVRHLANCCPLARLPLLGENCMVGDIQARRSWTCCVCSGAREALREADRYSYWSHAALRRNRNLSARAWTIPHVSPTSLPRACPPDPVALFWTGEEFKGLGPASATRSGGTQFSPRGIPRESHSGQEWRNVSAGWSYVFFATAPRTWVGLPIKIRSQVVDSRRWIPLVCHWLKSHVVVPSARIYGASPGPLKSVPA